MAERTDQSKTFCYAQFYVLKSNWAAVLFVRRHFTKHITLMGRNIVTFVFPLPSVLQQYDMVLATGPFTFASLYLLCASSEPNWLRVRESFDANIFSVSFSFSQISHISHFIMLLSSLRLFMCCDSILVPGAPFSPFSPSLSLPLLHSLLHLSLQLCVFVCSLA